MQTRIAKSVKLLLDENPPPRLADVLQSEFSGSIHVHSCGLGSADDEAIREQVNMKSSHFAIDLTLNNAMD